MSKKRKRDEIENEEDEPLEKDAKFQPSKWLLPLLSPRIGMALHVDGSFFDARFFDYPEDEAAMLDTDHALETWCPSMELFWRSSDGKQKREHRFDLDHTGIYDFVSRPKLAVVREETGIHQAGILKLIHDYSIQYMLTRGDLLAELRKFTTETWDADSRVLVIHALSEVRVTKPNRVFARVDVGEPREEASGIVRVRISFS